jgi:hypothetical protein
MRLQRMRRLLPALWAGWVLCVALLATPAPFATLAVPDAGRVVARMLAQEAYTALALGLVIVLFERTAARRGEGPQFSLDMGLALGTIFCTVAGYFALQPMLTAARAGQGALSFGQLHAISVAFFAVKLLLVHALAWRASKLSPVTSS